MNYKNSRNVAENEIILHGPSALRLLICIYANLFRGFKSEYLLSAVERWTVGCSIVPNKKN